MNNYNIKMKAKLEQDRKRRLVVNYHEYKRKYLKSIIKDEFICYNVREKAQEKLKLLARDSSSSRIVNRCFKTGRSRGVFKIFKLSRMNIKELAHSGRLSGMYKSSW